MAVAIAAEHVMDILQLEVQTAYLQSPVEEDVYVKPSPGYESLGNAMKQKNYSMAYVNQAKIGSEQSITRWRTTDSYQLGRTHAFVCTDQMRAWSCFSYMPTMLYW